VARITKATHNNCSNRCTTESIPRQLNRLAGLAVVASLGLFSLIGCSSETGNTQPAGKQPQQAADQVAGPNGSKVMSEVEQKLVGLWLGGAAIEEAEVKKAIEAKADLVAQEKLLTQAENFLSTEMAIQFSPDGTMEQHVEIFVGGEKQEMIGVGTWRVAKHRDNKAVVEVIETAADGTETKTERLFQFYPNGESFVMPAPVIDELADFNAVMVFQRIPDLAQQPSNQPMTR